MRFDHVSNCFIIATIREEGMGVELEDDIFKQSYLFTV